MPSVKIWEEPVVIPTYPPAAPDLNPMFLGKRVYQGSNGKVYPLPFTDRVSDERVHKTYTAVYLENEYLRVMVLPEIGGRVHIGQDKTDGYDFIYRNTVIKPALVGLCGPWICGGIEFNWPQHHRPTTFQTVDYILEEHPDGSRTVWVGEIEPMNHTKGMAGITLHPGRSYLEVKVRLYNRTPYPQTFLWWANLGVHANEHYQAFFPRDVDSVADHAKRATSSFPIATGTYYGVDYSRGVDISWFKNIPVPTSYMALSSDYDFLGGYDHGKRAGVIHIADHHLSPGKKLWTWGAGDFGRRWYEHLTDSDGPYIELMTGVFTDNQPDFAWLMPYETKTFSQYWYPIREMGMVKNANLDAAISLEMRDSVARITLNATREFANATVRLTHVQGFFWEERIVIAPDKPFGRDVRLPRSASASGLSVQLLTADGTEIIGYTPQPRENRPVPPPAQAAPPPEGIETNEALYLTGLHLEQYRHATYEPAAYYREALRRDPADARCNNALGMLLLRQGAFEEAAEHFRRAIRTLTQKNPNPYDGEPFYNLGLALRLLGREAEAYTAFYKSVWNYAWQSAGYYQLAELDCRKGQWHQALEHLDRSLACNAQHLKARNLKSCVLRQLGQTEQAESLARSTIALDRLDYFSRFELYRALAERGAAAEAKQALREMRALMRDQSRSYLDLAIDYAAAGIWTEAIAVLSQITASPDRPVDPLVYYHLGYYAAQNGEAEAASTYYRHAAQMPPDYCFPNRLESAAALLHAQQINPLDARAPYYLGNLLYDKQRYDEAIYYWERSRALDPGFSIVHRNLGLAYFNIQKNTAQAQAAYQQAFAANLEDARLLYESDQLDKRLNVSPEERLAWLEAHRKLVEQRDDLTLELITLHNQLGHYDTALDLLARRNFHPWEGGEGKVTEQYFFALVRRGCAHLEKGRAEAALRDFLATLTLPQNLGEGRHEVLLAEAHLFYHIGAAYTALGDERRAVEFFEKAATEDKPEAEMDFYRGLALRQLGRAGVAEQKFRRLIETGNARLQADHRIDYFAISLPTFLVFEDDLAKRNAVEGHYLLGLGYFGLDRVLEAATEFESVLDLDVNHLGALTQLAVIRGHQPAPWMTKSVGAYA